MSSKVKTKFIPNIFDRVHSPYYGYGTVIGVSDADSGYGAVILFDFRDSSLHSAGDYAKACNESHFPVSTDVRRDRCFWVQVYVSAPDEENSFNTDEVRLVPFGSLEYRQHPIRVSIDVALGDLSETRSASVVAIDRTGGSTIVVVAFDKIEGDATLHSGKGRTAHCDNILNILWPKEDIYYWATPDELSFHDELMGTAPYFDIKEENNNNNNKGDEEKADAHVKEEEDTVSSPYYYKIARVEPNELMVDLMSFDQHEGFLWGNIIKYSYRYGNKGEKAETVKKIRKYCDMLLEILEPKSELED